MRLLFAHDHRFRRGPNGEIFSAGTFPANVWDRYLAHFDELHVIARDGGEIGADAALARSDRDQVSFEFLPSLASVRQRAFRWRALDRRMSEAVEASDALVARLPSEIGLLAVKHARRLGKPFAVEVVGCAWDSYRTTGVPGSSLYAPIAFFRTRRAIASAPQALYVTSSWLQRRYPTDGFATLASDVALPPVRAGDVSARRKRLAELAGGRAPLLGTIGTLQVKYKGLQTAFAALAQLRAQGRDLHYRVLGPGAAEPWRRLAERMGVADLVHFDGTRAAGASVWKWLDAIDIHLQPSFTEGLPRATIEAMSRGAACVGSTSGGIPELLPPDRLHAPGDADALAAIIARLAKDPAAIAAASERDRDETRQFDVELLNARRRDFYGRLHGLAAGKES